VHHEQIDHDQRDERLQRKYPGVPGALARWELVACGAGENVQATGCQNGERKKNE